MSGYSKANPDFISIPIVCVGSGKVFPSERISDFIAGEVPISIS
jgi:hypothetical protein